MIRLLTKQLANRAENDLGADDDGEDANSKREKFSQVRRLQ
ncbi:hypothetical protein [Luteolibacter soli]|uniref:Uncharacterized protein n=1 Tax=Luteolibacter soli TaxID=3135280 RepID=A0ABU9ARP8_9BACT